VNCTNAAGTIAVVGGTLLVCAGAVGSVTWKSMAQQYEVMQGMTVQHAITAAAADAPAPAAAAPYVVQIHAGIHVGPVVCSSHVRLRGINKWGVTLQVVNADLVTLASNVSIENLRLRITVPDAQRSLIRDGGAACTDVMIRDVALLYTTPAAIGNLGIWLSGGSVVRLERCSTVWSVPGTGAEITVYVTTAASTVTIDHCDFRNDNVTAGSHIYVAFAGSVVTISGTRLSGNVTHLVCTAGIIRISNSQYKSVNRGNPGNIVDESPEAKDYIFHVIKKDWAALIASSNLATRTAVGGSVTAGGAGQSVLRINDNAVDASGVENPADAAGGLDSSWTPARTPRYCQQVSFNALRATTTAFYGLRETLGAAIPGAAEEHAGFDWNGANFRAVSGDGAVQEATNLTAPSTGAQHQLEVIVFGSVSVEFYVDGKLVATHVTRVPSAALDFQEYEISDGGGGATTSDVTLRNGFIQECPA